MSTEKPRHPMILAGMIRLRAERIIERHVREFHDDCTDAEIQLKLCDELDAALLTLQLTASVKEKQR